MTTQPDTPMPAPTVQATRYEVSLLPADDINRPVFTLTVEYRGADQWAVCAMGRQCLGKDGTWGYEPSPSSRDDGWIAAHRFDLDTAIEFAKQHASLLTVNGHTALDAYRRTHPALTKETAR